MAAPAGAAKIKSYHHQELRRSLDPADRVTAERKLADPHKEVDHTDDWQDRLAVVPPASPVPTRPTGPPP